MNYELFENDEQRRDAQAALKGFTDTKGWELIVKALDANARFFEDQLRENLRDRTFDNLEQANSLQKRIDDIQALKDLPKTLLEAAQIDTEEDEEEQIYDAPEGN